MKRNRKVIRLTESDLIRITRKVLREQKDYMGTFGDDNSLSWMDKRSRKEMKGDEYGESDEHVFYSFEEYKNSPFYSDVDNWWDINIPGRDKQNEFFFNQYLEKYGPFIVKVKK